MKVALFIALILLVILVVILAVRHDQELPTSIEPPVAEHTYATWDKMEFDKCVVAWLIVRFIDENAKFVFYPQGSEIKGCVVFDVPGATWSRKHQTCTSDCILELLNIDDSAVKKIVGMAHNVELNFWQLDRFLKLKNVLMMLARLSKLSRTDNIAIKRHAHILICYMID